MPNRAIDYALDPHGLDAYLDGAPDVDGGRLNGRELLAAGGPWGMYPAAA